MQKLSTLLPPTSQLIFSDVDIKPGKPATQTNEATAAGIKAYAWVKTQAAVDQLEDRLAAAGYFIANPALPEPNKFDPDYSLLYTLNADQLFPKPAPTRPAAAPTK
jgi:hypothetical protein